MLKKIINKIMDYLSKFSVEQEDVIGVSITPSCIRLAQLDSNNHWTLTKLGYKYIEGDSDLNSIKEQPEQYISKLSQIITSSKISTTNAAVSIPVSSAIIKVVNLPLMTDEELQEAVHTDSLWENTVQLADNLDEYSIFWQVLKRDTSANNMDLLFVASKLDDIDHYLNIVRQSGLNPVVVDVGCFAIRNALTLREDLKETVHPIAIVEFGCYENYILILHGDSPFISDIWMADKDRNLLLKSDIDEESLERVGEHFSMQVSQMLSSYQSKYKIQPIETLLVSSSIPVIGNIVDSIQKALPEIKIEVFNALQQLTIPENLKEKAFSEPNPSVFSSVLGLATRRLDVFGHYEYVTGTNNINLLPDREGVVNQEKMKFLSRWGIVIFIVVAIIFSVSSFFSGQFEGGELDLQLGEYNNLEIQKNTKQIVLSELIAEKQKLSGMLEASKNINSNQNFLYLVLLGINSSVPQGVSLNSIDYTGANILTITGLSISDQNILQFIDNLSQSKAIDKSSLLTMSIKVVNKRTFKSFSIKCTLAEQISVDKKEKANGN
jgi:type IV pilus assembly protein PilN